MPVATGLTVIKSFDYRGKPEEWSNKYWLTGAVPADDTAWRALATAVSDHEKAVYSGDSKIVRFYGHADTDSHADAVFIWDLTAEAAEITGTLVGDANAHWYAGDQAGMVSWRTSRKTTRGKWIYLRKFFHSGWILQSQKDQISPLTKAAYNTFATAMANGSLPDGRIVRSPTQDETLTVGGGASDFVTTRTLKRRGKRPVAATP